MAYKVKNPGLSLPPAVAPDLTPAAPVSHLQLPGKGARVAAIDTGSGEDTLTQNE